MQTPSRSRLASAIASAFSRDGGRVDVEDAAALGVRERAHSVLGREARELRRRLAAAAEDHEREHLRQRDEHARALAIRRAHEPDRAARKPRVLERGPQHVVDEHGHRAQRGAPGAQDGGVEALQQLPGDVERDVRARLEVRADRADRDPPLADHEPVRERARADLALERRQRGHRLDLRRERVDPALVEPEPVEHPLVELPLGGGAVRLVREQDLGAALAHERGRALERRGDAVVGERRERAPGLGGLPLDQRPQVDLLIQRHYLVATKIPRRVGSSPAGCRSGRTGRS